MNFYELCVSMGLYSDMKEENLMNCVMEIGGQRLKLVLAHELSCWMTRAKLSLHIIYELSKFIFSNLKKIIVNEILIHF